MSNTLTEKLSKLKLFCDLPKEDLEKLSKHCAWKTLKTAERLFSVGDSADFIYLVGYGAIKLVKPLENGSEVTMHFVPRGGVLAAVVALKPKGKYPLTAFAVEDSAVIQISRDAFITVFQKHTVLGPKLIDLISDRINELHSQKSLSKSSVQNRIAEFLLRTLEAQDPVAGDKILMRLTRQDIANCVGSTVETVIRVLSSWTQDNIINTVDHRIEILNKKALKEILSSHDK